MRIITDQAPIELDPEDDEHRVALAATGRFGAQAAGALPISAETGRMLLTLRSDGVLEPGTWGTVSGAHKITEAPEDAAMRELREETGWTGDDAEVVMIPAYVFQEAAFVFRNHIAIVPEEFVPSLGWEADDHVWCTLDDLPSPLHFGIAALIADPASRALIADGWRDHVPATAPAEAVPLSLPRPLSPETAERIAKGVTSIIEGQAARHDAMLAAMGLDPLTAVVTVEPPFEMRSLPAGSGGTTLAGPDFDPKDGFVIMFSDAHPQGEIIEAGGVPVDTASEGSKDPEHGKG
jgi:8-oxo-dGTP pyrophosphatase MutT (NUDIX family)